MAVTQDYTKMMQDMMGAFPADMSVFQDMAKNSAELSAKFASIALEAADKSAELSTKLTRDTLAKLGEVSAVKEEAADYSKAINDFAAAQTAMASESIAEFTSVAQNAQAKSVELMMAAGKELSGEAQEMVQTAAKAAKPAKK